MERTFFSIICLTHPLHNMHRRLSECFIPWASCCFWALRTLSDSKAFYIVTEKQDLISEFVINDLHHTITVLDAKGGFTNVKNPVLFAVIPTSEYYRFKEGIRIIDPKAFFTVVDAYEVMGGE